MAASTATLCAPACLDSYHRLHAVAAAAAVAVAAVVVVVVVGRFLVFALSFGVGQLVVFLPAHAPVLEPHLHLPFGQTERVGHLDAAAAREIAAEVKLLLELQDLLSRVGRPQPLWLRAHVIWINCKNKEQRWFTDRFKFILFILQLLFCFVFRNDEDGPG